ncbi:cilia- and flagella-associated protein 251-like [Spodoptera litura]|uniref:Cilia- and flagella-associated protein 251 n=1 Tax=Spodoptera litura TaxID=69820 RepID=A0A9J7E059_SPOLT|nr:cilia- and flagella-associated protein 251-like [Spodoptera litura]
MGSRMYSSMPALSYSDNDNADNNSNMFRQYKSLSQAFFTKYQEQTGISPATAQKPAPFKMRWINGFNHKVGVINLNDRGSTILFYSASNCGVIYNWSTHQMWLLQGHRHMITCIAADERGRWLVTADSGAENVLIVWDFKDLFPQKTFFAPHGNAKIAKVAISSDAKYLLSMAYTSEKMSLYFWIWSYGQDYPHAIYEESSILRDSIVELGFNPSKSEQFLMMTRINIYIGVSKRVVLVERGISKETDRWEIKVKSMDKVNPEYGKLMCYTFVKGASQILVGTSRGAVLVYGYTIEYKANVEPLNIERLRYIKMLKLNKKMIHVIKNIDGVIVTGNSCGEIHFYDYQLRLLYWVHGFTVDRVKALSFNISPRSSMILDPKCNKICPCWEKVEVEKDPVTGEIQQKLIKMRLPSDATVGGKPFLVRDFIITTYNQGVGFVDFVTEKYTTLLDHNRSLVQTMSVHPEKTILCLGYKNGIVELFDFLLHKLVTRLDLRSTYTVVVPPNDDSINCNFAITVPELSVTCLKYSPSGMHLACGLNTGQILFLDPTTIDILTPTPFYDTNGDIKYMCFSQDSISLATADAGRTVCVYKYNCKTFKWVFIGKHRSHYKDITALVFMPFKTDGGEYKLVSLGLDRCMVEYDIASSNEEYLEIVSLDRVDQTALPLAAIAWPTPADLNPEEYRTDLPMLLMANDEYKYKIVNYATTMTLSTVLGPRYDHPVNRMQLITNKIGDENNQYLLFGCREVIGMQKMPLDGNPWKHVGLLGHPVKVLEMCFREDLEILFTIGARDTTYTQWIAHFKSVETTTKRGGPNLDPYYCLVENGRPGWLFQEIRDLFYYIQILCQGTFSPARRRVKDYIPIDSLPDLMRALGFFPSEYEVENLLIEARYKVYLHTPVTEIDFEEFVKLYLNHRPVFGENFKCLRLAFRTFANVTKNGFSIKRNDFIEILTSNGEYFTRELCWYLLTILSGHSIEDRALMNEDDFSFLPECISFTDLVTEIIGIQEMDNVSDTYTGLESMASLHTIESNDSNDEK